MASPKFKKYPLDKRNCQLPEISSEKDKVLKLLNNIEKELKKPEKLGKAINIINNWISNQKLKP